MWGESVAVTTETGDPAVESVGLFIQPAELQAGHQCGSESTYTTVTCEAEPHLMEMGVRKSSRASCPASWEGYIDESRGSALVQLWGPDTGKARQLVKDLLADPLLGSQTSRSLNDDGDRLPEAVTTVSAVARVLVTGMSGTGKTTVLNELRRRGHVTVDTDCDGWTLPDGLWDEPRMARLLASPGVVVVSGTVENQGRFYDRFDQVVLLSAPLDVLIERVSKRTNNPYGKDPGQQAEIAGYVETVEPLLRRGATLELDGRLPPSELADRIEELIVPT